MVLTSVINRLHFMRLADGKKMNRSLGIRIFIIDSLDHSVTIVVKITA